MDPSIVLTEIEFQINNMDMAIILLESELQIRNISEPHR